MKVLQIPSFSILHTSARPHRWHAIYDAWLTAADYSDGVEYVLCVAERWGFRPGDFGPWLESRPGLNKLVWNTKAGGYVSGVNCAAAISTGTVLVVNADDQWPCQSWDMHLTERLEVALHWKKSAIVIEVSTGTTNEHDRGIMVMPVLTRARYEQFGYVFFPEFESMYADNDFCEQARHDNAVIDARHLMFPHRHPTIDVSIPIDEAYQQQNRPEAHRLGKKIIDHRRLERVAAAEFPVNEDGSLKVSAAPTIALCLSGENFHGAWVDGLLNLYDHLIHSGFNIFRFRGYQSNVYVTREEIRQAMKTIEPHPDLLLWLDDDNILTPENFDLLAHALNRSDCDGITGWCWIHDEENKRFRISCGTIAPDGLHWNSFTPAEFAAHKEPFEVPGLATGFPCFLMRWSAMEKAGDKPFLPFLHESLPAGMNGEDIAFSIRAMKGGARFLVDPRVQVPHLKYTDTIPSFPAEESPEPKIAVMMRVKNEGRWIDRCIKAAKELSSRIYVMDDGSTDETVRLCLEAGVTVLTSPFLGGELDEARDKNWLLDLVVADYHPDWILCIDGDEELEPQGALKIREALKHARHDTYALKFLYLWDRPDRARLDRWYQSFHRLSLFRPDSDLRFRSLYAGRGVHSGLHTGNAPVGDEGLQITPGLLNVYLLHYGYMYKEDRIRKYEYYNRIDPGNEIEDRYRHIVQGDVPEVPWDMVLRHAGPLDIRTLPESFLRRPLLEIREPVESSAAD